MRRMIRSPLILSPRRRMPLLLLRPTTTTGRDWRMSMSSVAQAVGNLNLLPPPNNDNGSPDDYYSFNSPPKQQHYKRQRLQKRRSTNHNNGHSHFSFSVSGSSASSSSSEMLGTDAIYHRSLDNEEEKDAEERFDRNHPQWAVQVCSSPHRRNQHHRQPSSSPPPPSPALFLFGGSIRNHHNHHHFLSPSSGTGSTAIRTFHSSAASERLAAILFGISALSAVSYGALTAVKAFQELSNHSRSSPIEENKDETTADPQDTTRGQQEAGQSSSSTSSFSTFEEGPRENIFVKWFNLRTGYYEGGFEETMTKQEAALILGVRQSSTSTRIKEAHRKLLILNHPDTGGSTYLAGKINEAKELLLKGRRGDK